LTTDIELQKYYENQFELFSTIGWKDLLEDLQELYTAVNDVNSVEDANTLFYRKGQIDILNLIFDRKNACETAWSDLNGS
jgi:hypothetical protein